MNLRNFLSFFVVSIFLVFAYYFPKALESIFQASSISFGASGSGKFSFDPLTEMIISIIVFSLLIYFVNRRGGIKIGRIHIRI